MANAPATTSSETPTETATAAAAAALPAWCSPTSPMDTRASLPSYDSRKVGRPTSSSLTSSNRTSAPGAVPKVTTRPRVRSRMAETRGSSAFRTAVPLSSSASTSSPFACAMPCWEPNSPMCALPTLRTSETSGRATSHAARRSPMWRAPISRTRCSVAVSARSTVSGRPSSLLKEPYVATVVPSAASTWASRSLVLVLPWEPVSATTRTSSSRSSTWWASRARAATTSPTTTPGSPVSREDSTAAPSARIAVVAKS